MHVPVSTYLPSLSARRDFFKRAGKARHKGHGRNLWITATEDDHNHEKVIRVYSELAEPFDLLLAPDFAERARTEVEQIRQAAKTATGDPEGSPVAVMNCTLPAPRPVSIFEALAEGVGFEPTSALRRQQFSRLPVRTRPPL